MHSLRIFLFVCVLALPAFGQQISEVDLRADLQFLSSDALEGRLSLANSANVTAQFIAAEFAKAGLKPANGNSFFQEFRLLAYEPDTKATALALDRGGAIETFRYGADFRGGFPKDVAAKAPVVFAGYGITAPEYGYDDYAGVDARGKIVLVFDHEPRETDPKSVFNGTGNTRHATRWQKTLNAQKHGAAGLLLASEPLRKHTSLFDAVRAVPPGGTSERSGRASLRASAPVQALEDSEIRIPAFAVSDAVAAKLLAAAGKTPAELQQAIDKDLKPASIALPDSVIEMRTANKQIAPGVSWNVAGIIEGSDPALRNEAVLLDAHYDHLGVHGGRVYPGANDNGTGTAGLLELARAFEVSPVKPKRSVLFVAFGSEEEGLLGSYYYVAHPLRALAATRAVINLDMIGRDEAHIPQSEGVLAISKDTSNELNLVGVFYSPDLRRVIQRENEKAGLTISEKFDREHALNTLFRCDHFPFLLRDVPAVWFFGGFHPGYHEPSDTIEKINFPKFVKIVKLAYLTALSVADSPTPPRFKSSDK